MPPTFLLALAVMLVAILAPIVLLVEVMCVLKTPWRAFGVKLLKASAWGAATSIVLDLGFTIVVGDALTVSRTLWVAGFGWSAAAMATAVVIGWLASDANSWQ